MSESEDDKGRDPAVFAQNVRRAREIRSWTRGFLCQAAGISPQTLAKVERGGGCALRVERKLAEALGTVVGRLWEPLDLRYYAKRTADSDRWYFAGHADCERYRRAQGFADGAEPMRYDPDAIQNAEERRRMGLGGLASGFVRVTTAHLRAGTVISSLIELYGRVESSLPAGSLAYYYVVCGTARFHVLGETHELAEGDVFQTEMGPDAWIERTESAITPTLVTFVDLAIRRAKTVG